MVESFTRQHLEPALRCRKGNIYSTARLSGRHRRAFFELMRRNGIGAGKFKGSGASRPEPSPRTRSGSPPSDTSDHLPRTAESHN